MFNKQLKKLTMAAFAAVLVLPSCRSLVLENRSDCPSFLFFDVLNEAEFSGTSQVHISVFDMLEENVAAKDTALMKDIVSGDFYMKLPRGGAWNGFGMLGFKGTAFEGGRRFVVQPGSDYVPMYRFSFETEGFEESKHVPVEFFKEHSRVRIRFSNFDAYTGADGMFPFEIVIRSNTCGIDAESGLPVRGEFTVKPDELEPGEFEFILPRQADNNLKMEIWVKESVNYYDEGMIENFSLWELFNRLGSVSWTEKNLPDLELVIDYVEKSYRLTVSDWEDGGNFHWTI